MHLILLLIVLAPVLFFIHIVRAITRPYRYARRASRFGSRWGGYGGGFGGYGNRYGRRRGLLGPGLLSLLAVFALERFFDGNRR